MSLRDTRSNTDLANMRIFHGAVEIAGQGTLSVRGLRQMGLEANMFASEHPFAYETPDIVAPRNRVAFIRAAVRAARNHDVFHFYYGLGFHPALHLFDVETLLAMKKRVIVEFVGSDVRMPTVEEARNPNYVPIAGEDDRTAARRARRWAQMTQGHAIVCDHALDPFIKPYFPNVHYVGQRVDTKRYLAKPPSVDVPVPLVVHAPSHLAGKGTVHLRRAVDELRSEGLALEYRELHGVPHGEIAAACADADLIVDQLCSGAHGVFAVEAMSMGKPVICNLLPEYAAGLPADCPLINAEPGTIKEVLRDWLQRPNDRHIVGIASRDYAERNHDIEVVARRLAAIYAALPQGSLRRPRRSAWLDAAGTPVLHDLRARPRE